MTLGERIEALRNAGGLVAAKRSVVQTQIHAARLGESAPYRLSIVHLGDGAESIFRTVRVSDGGIVREWRSSKFGRDAYLLAVAHVNGLNARSAAAK
jgi:hypothetical protein